MWEAGSVSCTITSSKHAKVSSKSLMTSSMTRMNQPRLWEAPYGMTNHPTSRVGEQEYVRGRFPIGDDWWHDEIKSNSQKSLPIEGGIDAGRWHRQDGVQRNEVDGHAQVSICFSMTTKG